MLGFIFVLREYERGVLFRLGRLVDSSRGPGLVFLVPIVDRMIKVDLRTITLTIPPQEVITKDNVPVRVNAVAYFRIVDPRNAIVQVENFMVATSQIAQTTLRSVLGQHVLDELLSEREKINAILQGIIDEATGPWGVKVSIVEVKDVEIPSGMQRAMARQAEAELAVRKLRERPGVARDVDDHLLTSHRRVEVRDDTDLPGAIGRQAQGLGRRPVFVSRADRALLELLCGRRRNLGAADAGPPRPLRRDGDDAPRERVAPEFGQLPPSDFFVARSKKGLIRSTGAGKTIVEEFVEPISSRVCR